MHANQHWNMSHISWERPLKDHWLDHIRVKWCTIYHWTNKRETATIPLLFYLSDANICWIISTRHQSAKDMLLCSCQYAVCISLYHNEKRRKQQRLHFFVTRYLVTVIHLMSSNKATSNFIYWSSRKKFQGKNKLARKMKEKKLLNKRKYPSLNRKAMFLKVNIAITGSSWNHLRGYTGHYINIPSQMIFITTS